jgi:hypothetical protein
MDGKLTSTSVTESTVINASLSSIWRLIKLKEFGNFYTGITKSESVPSTADGETDIVKWTFKDGTVLEVKEEEYSVHSAGA